MKFLRKLAGGYSKGSLGFAAREKRHALFLQLVETIGSEQVKILDLGGSYAYWKTFNLDFSKVSSLVAVNTTLRESAHPKMTCVVGDARSLPDFEDGEFDIVFSNSTIEHVGTLDDQSRMADEVRRVGKAYFIQTPNFYFPMEPHFLMPGFQWLPMSLRVGLHKRLNMGNHEKEKDHLKATGLIEYTRLMTHKEMRLLFPDGNIYREKCLGLTKSLVAYKFPDGDSSKRLED